MNLVTTITGLPFVGKTTLFNLLTGQHVATGTFAGAEAETNVGVAKVPDERLDKLVPLFKPKKITHAEITYRDLGLAKGGGRLTTFEIDPGRHALARTHFERAGLRDRVTAVLGDAHAEAPRQKEPIDLLFLDADKEGYLDYLQRLSPRVRAGGLIVAHNMASPPPDPRYIQAVTADPAYETVFLYMHDAGVGVTLKKR